jgi:hypothetical protein
MKINEQEFKLAKDSQKMPHPKCNPKQKGKLVGEKWLTRIAFSLIFL